MARWAVVGAGPCGIASLGRLVDNGHHVYWIDPFFKCGRMGKYYRNVPANTPVNDLIFSLRLCNSFDFDASQRLRKIKKEAVISDLINKDDYCSLGLLSDALDDAISNLSTSSLVTRIEATLISAAQLSVNGMKSWKLNFDRSPLVEVNAMILSCGGVPRSIAKQKINAEIFSMDKMVCPEFVKELLSSRPALLDEVWLVAGGSHSAILIVKNLVELGAKNIVNIYRGDLKFMHESDGGWLRYQGTGLKGPVGDWAKRSIPCPQVTRVRWDENQSWNDYCSKYNVTAAVFAIGFELCNINSSSFGCQETLFPRVFLDESESNEMTSTDFANYDTFSGELGQLGNIFGAGIAFPEHHVDGGGNIEPWVGFKRTIYQTDLMLDVYNKKHG